MTHALRQQGFLAGAAMFGGLALLVTVLTRVSLALSLLCCALCLGALARRLWLHLPPAARPIAAERVRLGLLAGVLATSAYDLVRLVLVKATGFAFWPFDALPLFGQSILGAGAPHALVLVAGTAYHYLNGMFFAAAYTLLFRRRLFVFGVTWALGLEAAMLLVYPYWLPHLRTVMAEFTVVSLTGHLTYGTTVGLVGQHAPWVGRRPLLERAR